MKILFLLLSCLTCHAQFPYSGTTWSVASTTTKDPTTLVTQKPEHWWRASDLGGVSPLNYNWEDRIQINYFWKYDTSSSEVAPVVTANSVTFNGNTTLTNDTRTYNFTSASLFRTVVVVIKPASGHTATYVLLCNNALNGIAWSLASKRIYADNLTVTSTGGTNNFLQDWVITQTNVSATPGMIAFTNNVQSGGAANAGSSVSIYQMGGNNGGAEFFGDIYEVVCLTNVPGYGGFTNVTDLADLHYYFTNRYGFSP